MTTFVQIDPPAPIYIAERHLGKRLLAQRERLGIPLDAAALALQVDSHTVTALEAGDAIPPRLSARLRTYVLRLEAMREQPLSADPAPLPEAEGQGERLDQGDGPSDDADAPSSPPSTDPFPAWVRDERQKRGWTLRELARRADLSYSTLSNIETGHHNPGPVARARLVALLTDQAPPASPTTDQCEASLRDQPLTTSLLDADTSATLRSRLIHAMLDRKLNQHEMATALGLPAKVIKGIIKSPDVLLPQDLAATITAWLNRETEAPMPKPAPDVAEELLNDPAPLPPPAVEPLSTPPADTPTLGQAIRRLVESLHQPTASSETEDDREAEGDTDADTPDEPRLDPRPMRLFNSFQFHLPRPNGRDVALLALLDKFPDYADMTSTGEQSQWFRYFEAFTRLALAAKETD